MTLTVNFAGVESTVTSLEQATKNIGDELAALEATSSVLSSQWDGTAQAAYAHAHEQWSAELARLRALLRQGSALLQSARENYERGDNAVTDGWSIT